MPVSIGSDYSSSTVYLGCLTDRKVLATASVDMTNLLGAVSMLRSILSSYHSEFQTTDHMWIEQSWVNGMHFPKSGLMLARTSAFIEIAALEVGMSPIFVHPLTWRKYIYGNGRPKDAKEVARKYVDENFDYEVTHKNQHNVCEAILLAHYGNLMTITKEATMTNVEEGS